MAASGYRLLWEGSAAIAAIDRVRSQAGTEASHDALRAPADLRFVGAQRLGDRVERFAIEQHREHRKVVIVESRDGCFEYVMWDRWHRDLAVRDATERSEQRRHRPCLVHHAVGLCGTSRQGQRRACVRGVDDHSRRLRATLDAPSNAKARRCARGRSRRPAHQDASRRAHGRAWWRSTRRLRPPGLARNRSAGADRRGRQGGHPRGRCEA